LRMINQEIEDSDSIENQRRNPLEVCRKIPVTRPNEPHIERADDACRYSSEIGHISRQPVFNKRTGKVSHNESKNDESQ